MQIKDVFSRFTEPSSHAGIAILLQAAKAFFPEYAGVIDGATAFFGALAVALREKSSKPQS